MRWVYAGQLGLGDRLEWGGNPGGNIPQSGMVPNLDDTGLYLLVRTLANEGHYHGCDPDFDASALKLNGDELLGLLDSHYGSETLAGCKGALRAYVDLARQLWGQPTTSRWWQWQCRRHPATFISAGQIGEIVGVRWFDTITVVSASLRIGALQFACVRP